MELTARITIQIHTTETTLSDQARSEIARAVNVAFARDAMQRFNSANGARQVMRYTVDVAPTTCAAHNLPLYQCADCAPLGKWEPRERD